MRGPFLAMFMLALTALPAPAQDADDSPMPVAVPRLYYPASNNTDFTLGTMRLGTGFASFSLLRGHMDLVFAGEMVDPEGLGKEKMRVFRITNAQAFFHANKGRNGFCPSPLMYLGVARLPGDNIRVAQFHVSGPKGLLDETVRFRDSEPGGLSLCEADTFDDGRVRMSSGEESIMSTIQRPMAAPDVRRMIIGSWIVPDQNADKFPEASLQRVQVFRPDGTGVLLPYEHASCGAQTLRRFSWAVRGDAVWVRQVSPASSADDVLLIGEGQTRVFQARTPGLFAQQDRGFRLARIPDCRRS